MTRALTCIAFLSLACAACAGTTGGYVPHDLTDRAAPPVARESAPRTNAGDGSGAAELPKPLARRRSAARSKPVEARLSSGVRVVMLERHEFPATSLSFVLDVGAAGAPSGVASLYAHALRGGSDEYTSQEAFEYLQYAGAQLRTSATQDSVTLTLRALSPLLGPSLRHAAPMFVSPNLDGKDLDSARVAAKAEAKEALDDPSEQALATVRSLVFDAANPYARPVYASNLGRYEKMSRQELESFRTMFVAPERVSVVVVGDFNRGALLASLERVTAPLAKRKASQPPPIPPARRPVAPRVVVVPRRGASQSNVAIGFVAPPARDPIHAELAVLGSFLGRGLSGRLNLKTRGEHGWTYGVHMYDRAYRDGGLVHIEAAVDTPHTARAVADLVAELARVANEPLSEDDLARAKAHALDNLDETALVHLVASGLPIDHYTALAKRIDALTEEEVRSAARTILATDVVQIAVVGDPDAVVAPLKALGLGPVTVR